jgi:ribose transport system substrate-binding protein
VSAMHRRIIAVVALAWVVVLAGCGGQLAPNTEKGIRIGFVPKSLNQEYWVNTKHGADAGGRAANAKVLTLAGRDDTHIDEQINIVQNLLAEKVDALVIAPTNSDLLQPVLDKAAKKIPVVIFDSPMTGWKPQTGYVGTANKTGGVAMGKYLAKVIPHGTLAIIRGVPGSQVDIDRVNGVKAGIKGSGIKVVKEVAANFDRQQAVGAMEDIIQTNPHVSAVFCANDQMALGALQSLDAQKLTSKIKLVGFDGAIEATQQIIAGKMFATIAQDPYGMAKIAVQEATAKVKGKRVPKSVNTGNPLITRKNAEAYFKKAEKKLGGPT